MRSETAPDDRSQEGRKSASFLVRVWAEQKEASGDSDSPLRVYVKDLQTGEESYLQDPGGLGERMRRSLGSDGA